MKERMFLALALSLGVIMIFSYIQQPSQQKLAEKQQQSTQKSTQSGDTTPDATEQQPAEATSQNPAGEKETESLPSDTAPQVQPAQADVQPDTVTFELSGLKGTFNTFGGRFTSIKTTKYNHIDNENELYDLVYREGNGLKYALNYPESSNQRDLYKHVPTEDTRTFKFRLTRPDGLVVTKTYRFLPQDYRVDLDVQLSNTSGQEITLEDLNFPDGPDNMGSAVRWGPGFGQGRDEKTQFDKVYFYYGKNGEMNYLAPQGAGGFYSMIPFMGNGEDEDKPHNYVEGPLEWSAVSNRYFIAAVIPESPYEGAFLDKGDKSDSFVTYSAHDTIELEEAEKTSFSYELFLGPKHYSTLQSFHSGLESTLNYGWFTLLTYPLLIALRWIYAVIPNYGIAIILLSVAIKFLLYPLTKKGLVSMQKMKKLQPKMKEIQEEYSDDKEKLNEKLMEFYSEHNVNPLGGCLPMLMQLPIFIALYRMLEYSIELRGAYFAFWVTDLSAKDPYYILPVVMGVLMFFQQWYTMSASTGGATGQQQKMMMYIMPVVFVVLFMRFPVGLVLYWMTNSAVTLLQYWMINQSMDLDVEEA
ncbi:MAG: membrane protein insertase YidC [bacterium]